jgi:hypothetical protein
MVTHADAVGMRSFAAFLVIVHRHFAPLHNMASAACAWLAQEAADMHFEAAAAHRDNMSLRAQLLAVEQQLFRARQRHQQEVRCASGHAPSLVHCLC